MIFTTNKWEVITVLLPIMMATNGNFVVDDHISGITSYDHFMMVLDDM